MVPAAGTELAYLRLGEGAPLVVIPGGPRFGFAHVRPVLDVLANDRELIYFDERGSGSSRAGDPASISTAGTLSDLDALLDGLELEQVALAGHSLAAHMVALYAATRSERVRALVLLNPAPPFAPEHREQFGKEMTSRRTPGDADELERIKTSSEYEAGDVAAVERYYQVIHGERDPVPVASAAAIADAIPQGQLVVIPGSSHYGFLESPETVAAAVEAFLVAHAA